ncbi:MAG: ABC-type transport auxiliary lipoprotein family protein [Thermoanaerobaculia bacterium]
MRPDLRRPLAALTLAAAVSGCASRQPLAVQRFMLAMPDGPIPEPGPAARLVALPPVRVSPLYLDPSLVYHVGGGRVETDPYASLAAAPRFLMTSAIRAYLLRQPGVKNVVQGFVGPNGLTLDVVVQELSGDFSRPGEPAGVLSLEVAFYRGDPVPGTAPLLRKVYTRREALPGRTAAAVVAAWGRVLPSIMAELGADLASLPTGS